MKNIEIKTKGYRPQTMLFDKTTYIEAFKYEWRCKMNLGKPKFYTLIDNKEQSINKILFNMNRNQILIHKNGNTHDFNLDNIEILTRTEYGRRYASKNSKSKKSKYKNVSWSNNSGKWLVRFTKENQVIYERYFDSEEDAAIVADYKNYEIFGTNNTKNYKDLSYEQLNAQYDDIVALFGETRLEIKSKSNQRNRKIIGLSEYVGVTLDKRRNKWYSHVKHHGTNYYCGSYEHEKDAAKAYNKKALELYGESARLNKV